MEDFLKNVATTTKKVAKTVKGKLKESDSYNAAKNAALSASLSVAENFVPILKESKFYQKGILTPEEFVRSGDKLVHHFPGWSWMEAVSGKDRDYLPLEKQYLVFRGALSERRVNEMDECMLEKLTIEGWTSVTDNFTDETAVVKTGTMDQRSDISSIGTNIDSTRATYDERSVNTRTSLVTELALSDINDHDIPSDYNNSDSEDEWVDAIKISDKVKKNPTRSYDVSLTYDRYYQTPRVWLSGFDEYGSPLLPDHIFEDIMSDYRKKTVDIDQHPHKNGGVHVCIHPCKHANVMKKLIDNLIEASERPPENYRNLPQPEDYLIIFLKFVQNVVPTVKYYD